MHEPILNYLVIKVSRVVYYIHATYVCNDNLYDNDRLTDIFLGLSEKSLYMGKTTTLVVQSSTNCRIGCWCIEKYFLPLVNNHAHSWLATAHVVPSPSPQYLYKTVYVNKEKSYLSLKH